MDWPRAKTILILAFLCLDALLGLRWWQERSGAAWPAVPASASRLRADLAELGIVLAGDLPSRYPREMRRLQVHARPVDAERLAARFLRLDAPGAAGPGGAEPGGGSGAGAGNPPAGGGEGRVYRRGGEVLTVLPPGLVLYERRDLPAGDVSASFDAEAARRVAESFLRERGLLPPDAPPTIGSCADPGRNVACLDYVLPTASGRPSGYQVVYVRRFRGWPVYDGYIGVEVIGGAVRAVESFWPDVGFAGDGHPVIGPEEALRKLAEQLSLGPGEKLLVDRIDLGYYGNYSNLGASDWQAVPVWRVLTKDGKSFYINAYSGRLEDSA